MPHGDVQGTGKAVRWLADDLEGPLIRLILSHSAHHTDCLLPVARYLIQEGDDHAGRAKLGDGMRTIYDTSCDFTLSSSRRRQIKWH